MRKVSLLLSILLLSFSMPVFASYCSHCGKYFENSANFCSNCGNRLNTTTNTTRLYTDGTSKNTTTYITPSCNCNTTITYTTTTPGYTYSTSSNGNTTVIYTNPAILPPPPPRVIYRPEPTLGEIIIGGIIAHQVWKHNHHDRPPRHYGHGPGPRPAPVSRDMGRRPPRR